MGRVGERSRYGPFWTLHRQKALKMRMRRKSSQRTKFMRFLHYAYLLPMVFFAICHEYALC